jgi:hypothetical protein
VTPGTWAYAVADLFRDLDSPDSFRRATAYTTVIAAGAAAWGVGVAATGVLVAAGAAGATAEAAGTVVLTAHASLRASQLGVTAAQVQNAISQGAAFYDTAYRNIAFFLSRGAGTLQIGTRTTTEGGASWIVEGVIARSQSIVEVGAITFKGGQRFLPILGGR